MSNYSYLFWGYTVVWAMIAAYVVFLTVRLQRVGRRLDRLERGTDRDDE